MRSTLLLLSLLLALVGCGKKGALYLPDKPAQPQLTQSR
ncbi:MAG: lipoprotein [Thiobacillaceae bacterium]|jgi:predicted small lipoprotein YifL|nr:lipoprotein [Thiobacillaceae bacterium]